jgi:hypothetical protein
MDVTAVPPNRSPSTATFPKLFTVKSADPRRPAIAPNPGRSLNATATFLFAAKGIVALPTVTPWTSRTMTVTTVSSELGFTTATAVTKLVSSQMRVLVLEEMPESGRLPPDLRATDYFGGRHRSLQRRLAKTKKHTPDSKVRCWALRLLPCLVGQDLQPRRRNLWVTDTLQCAPEARLAQPAKRMWDSAA